MSIDVQHDGFIVRKRVLMWVIVSIVTTVLILNCYYWLALHDDTNENAPTFVILLFLGLPCWFMHWALKGPRELFKASKQGVEYHSSDMNLIIVPWNEVNDISSVITRDSEGDLEYVLKVVFRSTKPKPYHGLIDDENDSVAYFYMEGRRDVDKIAFSAMELRNLYVQKTH